MNSFLKGVASIFDLAGSLDNLPDWNFPMSDAEALASDWQAIGGDFRKVLEGSKDVDATAGDSAGEPRR
jgi:hypothetical protein